MTDEAAAVQRSIPASRVASTTVLVAESVPAPNQGRPRRQTTSQAFLVTGVRVLAVLAAAPVPAAPAVAVARLLPAQPLSFASAARRVCLERWRPVLWPYVRCADPAAAGFAGPVRVEDGSRACGSIGGVRTRSGPGRRRGRLSVVFAGLATRSCRLCASGRAGGGGLAVG